MPLIVQREEVLGVYADAADRGWVIPTFCAENLTTIEAVLSAAREYGGRISCKNLPITIAITNLYPHRSQTSNYTHTRRWDTGLRLFLSDLITLTTEDSPFAELNVMVHLDHIQHDLDEALLSWDMRQFSSIMFDASALPLEQNMEATRRFVEQHGESIVIEGACDEIGDASKGSSCCLTTPEMAVEYMRKTGVDLIVANLGTEHRASAANIEYRPDIARQIKECVGTKIVLHGCSSATHDQVRALFDDGVCKVNIWTALERDSSPALLEDMVRNAAKVAGRKMASDLADSGCLGSMADLSSEADISYFTSCHRQEVVFAQMSRIVTEYLKLWYV